MKYFISLANRIIEIHSVFDKVKKASERYLVGEMTPDIVLHVSAKDIVLESESKLNIQQMPELEMLAVHRKIAQEMLRFNTFLMHGSVIAVGGKAYMFTAPSGTGKSTHVQKWIENLPNSIVVNGDKPLIIAGN